MSSRQYGFNSFVGAGKETAWGTKVTPSTFFEFNSESLSVQDEEQILETINGDRDFTRRLQGMRSVSGSVEGPFNPAVDFVMMLLANALGGAITSAGVSGETGAYEHVITTGDMLNGTISSMTLTKRLGETDKFAFTGCRVNSLTIKGDFGNFISISAEIVGKDIENESASIIPVLVDVEPCNFPAVSVWIAPLTASTVQDAANLQEIQSFELSISNNLITDGKARSMGSRTLDVLPPSRREVRLKLSQSYEGKDILDRSQAGVPYQAQLLLEARGKIASTGTQKYDCLFDLPEIYYNVPMPGASDMGILGVDPEFTCIKGKRSGKTYAIKATVHNATASY